jgi:hypothetical protein
MCERCVRKLKHLGVPKGKYGYIKALAHRFVQPFNFRVTKNGGLYMTGSVGLHWDRRIDIGVEAHMHKILQAKTKRRYNRKRGHGLEA